MSITLPEVPAARPGSSAVAAVLKPGVTLADPLPALTTADRAAAEQLRQTVDGIRSAILADLPKRASVGTDGRLVSAQIPSALLDRLSALERAMTAVQTAIGGGSTGGTGGSGGSTTPTTPVGSTTASPPSWAGPIPAAGDLALPTATRTPYELPNLPASGGNIVPALNALLGSSGTAQDGDRVLIPAGTWVRSGNVDWRKAGVVLIFGNAQLNAPATLVGTSPTEHGIRIYADRARLQGVSATAPLLLRATGITARGDKNQQGMSNLLLDPGCTNAVVQDVVSEGSAAAGVFCYGAVGFTFNRVGSRWSRADAFHSAAGASYGTWLDCWAEGPGDDLIAWVHYDGKDPATSVPHHMRVHRFRGVTNGHGRGLAVVGARDVWATDVSIEGTGAAGVIVGRETYGTTYERQPVVDVLLQRFTLRGCNWAEQDHGSVLLNNYSADAVVARVILEDFDVWDAVANRQAVRGIVYARSGQTAVGTIEALCRRFVFKGAQANSLYGGNVDSGSSIVRDSWSTDTSAGTTDTTKPSVIIYLPADGATVSGSVTVTGKAGDSRGLAKVELLVNGVVVGSTSSTSTVGGEGGVWSILWDSTTVANGDHVLTARATDAAGNTRTSNPRRETVGNTVSGGGSSDTTPPSVPTLNAGTRPASGTARWTWSASTDTGGSGLAGYRLRYSVQGGTLTLANGGNVITGTSFDVTGLSDGSGYYAEVQAVDVAGNASAWSSGQNAPTYVAPATPSPSAAAPPSTSAARLVYVDPVAATTAGDGRITTMPELVTGKAFGWGTEAERPFLVTPTDTTTTRKVARFDNRRMLLEDTGIAGKTRLTVTMVMALLRMPAEANCGLFSSSPAAVADTDKTSGQFVLMNPVSTSETAFASLSVSGAAASSGGHTLASPVPFGELVVVQAFLAADAVAPVVKIDGVQLSGSPTAPNQSTALQLGRMLLGSRWKGSVNQAASPSYFELGALLVHEGHLSSADQTAVRTWAADLWGTSRP